MTIYWPVPAIGLLVVNQALAMLGSEVEFVSFQENFRRELDDVGRRMNLVP